MMKDGFLYKQTVEVTTDYLGPAAKRFIDRQIVSHLNKEPKDLTQSDLAILVSWIEASVSLLTDDEDLVAEFVKKLEGLAYTAQDQ